MNVMKHVSSRHFEWVQHSEIPLHQTKPYFHCQSIINPIHSSIITSLSCTTSSLYARKSIASPKYPLQWQPNQSRKQWSYYIIYRRLLIPKCAPSWVDSKSLHVHSVFTLWFVACFHSSASFNHAYTDTGQSHSHERSPTNTIVRERTAHAHADCKPHLRSIVRGMSLFHPCMHACRFQVTKAAWLRIQGVPCDIFFFTVNCSTTCCSQACFASFSSFIASTSQVNTKVRGVN